MVETSRSDAGSKYNLGPEGDLEALQKQVDGLKRIADEKLNVWKQAWTNFAPLDQQLKPYNDLLKQQADLQNADFILRTHPPGDAETNKIYAAYPYFQQIPNILNQLQYQIQSEYPKIANLIQPHQAASEAVRLAAEDSKTATKQVETVEQKLATEKQEIEAREKVRALLEQKRPDESEEKLAAIARDPQARRKYKDEQDKEAGRKAEAILAFPSGQEIFLNEFLKDHGISFNHNELREEYEREKKEKGGTFTEAEFLGEQQKKIQKIAEQRYLFRLLGNRMAPDAEDYHVTVQKVANQFVQAIRENFTGTDPKDYPKELLKHFQGTLADSAAFKHTLIDDYRKEARELTDVRLSKVLEDARLAREKAA